MPSQTSPLVLAANTESAWTVNGPDVLNGLLLVNVKPTSLGDPAGTAILKVVETGVLHAQGWGFDQYVRIRNESSFPVEFVIVIHEVT